MIIAKQEFETLCDIAKELNEQEENELWEQLVDVIDNATTKIYVVIIQNSFNFDNMLGVMTFKNKRKAESYMNKKFKDLIADKNYDIIKRTDNCCVAYNEGLFAENHCQITIYEREVEE